MRLTMEDILPYNARVSWRKVFTLFCAPFIIWVSFFCAVWLFDRLDKFHDLMTLAPWSDFWLAAITSGVAGLSLATLGVLILLEVGDWRDK